MERKSKDESLLYSKPILVYQVAARRREVIMEDLELHLHQTHSDNYRI